MSVQDNQRERERERERGDGENKSQREFEIDLRVFFFFLLHLFRSESDRFMACFELNRTVLAWIGLNRKMGKKICICSHVDGCTTHPCVSDSGVLIQSVHLCFPGCMVCTSSLSYVGSLEEVEHPYFWSCGEIYPWTQIYLTFFFFPNVMGVSCNSIVDFMDHINLHL